MTKQQADSIPNIQINIIPTLIRMISIPIPKMWNNHITIDFRRFYLFLIGCFYMHQVISYGQVE
jgi:hypothetical protein